MRIIAITGGIGSGKSTVRRLFEEQGAVGIDADALARRVVEPGTEGALRIREAFGPEYFGTDGRLDRRRMAETVFADPRALKKLEAILHPLIRAAERDQIRKVEKESPDALVVVEIPLLAEGGRSAEYDGVVLVTAPRKVRISRLAASGRYSREEAEARMDRQAGDLERLSLATWTVENGGSLEDTERQIRKVLRSLARGGPA